MPRKLTELQQLQTGAYQDAGALSGSNVLYRELPGMKSFTNDFIRTWGLEPQLLVGGPAFVSSNFAIGETRLVNVSGNWFKWIGYGNGAAYNLAWRFYKYGVLVSDWLGLSANAGGVIGIDEKFLAEFDAVEIQNLSGAVVGVSFNYGRASNVASIRQ